MFRLFRFFPTRWWSPSAWRTWWSYVRWRLETYGVFFPDGKLNGQALRSLLRRLPSYLHWLSDMDRLHRQTGKSKTNI